MCCIEVARSWKIVWDLLLSVYRRLVSLAGRMYRWKELNGNFLRCRLVIVRASVRGIKGPGHCRGEVFPRLMNGWGYNLSGRGGLDGCGNWVCVLIILSLKGVSLWIIC